MKAYTKKYIFCCGLFLLAASALRAQQSQGLSTSTQLHAQQSQSLSASTQLRAQQSQSLSNSFAHPPDSVKPSVYWYWLSDNISARGVTKDLESMAAVGIGRAFIGNIGLDDMPFGKAKLFTPLWWEVTRQAMRTGGRVGVDIGMFNSPGWSQSGGPWIKPSQSMRYLAWSSTDIVGGKTIEVTLPVPGDDFQDVVVIAVPTVATDRLSDHKPNVTSDVTVKDIRNLSDGDLNTEAKIPEGTRALQLDFHTDQDFAAQNISLFPAHNTFVAECVLQVKTDTGYRTISSFLFDRSNSANNVGFTPFAPVVVGFPAAVGKDFRLVLKNIDGNAAFAEVQWSASPVVDHYPEKQLGKMFQTPLPLWDTYMWAPVKGGNDIATNEIINPSTVINITSSLQPGGKLQWKAPAGKWTILRYGMLPTGVHNSPATKEGQGLEVDKLSAQAIAGHFKAFIGQVLDSIKPEDRKTFKFVVADSYETGSQNWTDDMQAAFLKTYGYDPLPWLPVLSGIVVGSADQSDRFLWDLRRLVADRVAYDYVGALRKESNKHGLKLWLENYGHWGFPAEFLQYGGQSDEVGGEFWNEGTLGSIELRDASSSAHIYGKTKVSAESFTAGGATFYRYPAQLKKRGDYSFTEGVNNTLLHVYIEQPYDSTPGLNAWFGTEFNRNNTWFYTGKAFFDYVRRCNFLLQQGKPVKDVAYFIGEDAPKMRGTRNPALPQGYDFDYINAEVIMQRLSVKDGYLQLPDGLRYRLMVLPPQTTMRPALLQKIADLVKDGATIVGTAPDQSPSLQDYPAADAKVKQLASALWGTDTMQKVHAYGNGKVIHGLELPAVFDLLKVAPDLQWGHEPVLYTHRATDTSDIYFISNQGDTTIKFAPVFRVQGRKPAFWDAVTGSVRALPLYTEKGLGTEVPLKLAPAQSAFIIFTKGDVVTGNGLAGDKQASTNFANAKQANAAQVNEKGSAKNTKAIINSAPAKENFPDLQTFLTLKGPWSVQFGAYKQEGATNVVRFDTLQDWSHSTDDRIRYYSGTAVYRNTFTLKSIPAGKPVYLDLGKVGVLASVTVNGKDAGTVWTAPWRADISTALKAGKNEVIITVTNTWVNRLIGDSKLPAEQRKTYLNVNPFKPETPLEKAGLIGPVTLQMPE